MNMKVGDWEPSRTTFSGDAAFMAFVNRAKSESLYDTGVEVGADDHILTLITCDRSYAGKEGTAGDSGRWSAERKDYDKKEFGQGCLRWVWR